MHLQKVFVVQFKFIGYYIFIERKLKMFTDVNCACFVLFLSARNVSLQAPSEMFSFFLHTLEFMSSLLIKPRSDSLSAAWPAAMFALQNKMDIPLYLILITGGAERKDQCQGTGIARDWSQLREHTDRALSSLLQKVKTVFFSSSAYLG